MDVIYHRSNTHNPLHEGRSLGHVTVNGERLTKFNISQLGDRDYYEAQVEDAYSTGKMHGGYLFSPNSLVFAHETSFALANERSIGSFSLLGRLVRLEEGVRVGEGTELQSLTIVGEDTTIGNRSILRKSVRVGRASHIGSMAILGQETTAGSRSIIHTGTVVARNVTLGNGVVVGTQGRLERRVELHDNVEAMENVYVGQGSRIYDGVIIGEKAKIGAYTVIGKGALIGAEAEIGELGTLRPSAWIRAGEVVPTPEDASPYLRYYRQLYKDR